MPVTDLRYILGVPTEAPANPGFQRTRQLAGQPVSPYQSAIDFENAASSVQANRGLAYLQGIQNHQNEIAQQAQNIRIQQEAQLAAEQATQGLAGIQPDQPEYLSQRQQILQQNPNALLNPQFRNALGIYDQGYQRVAQQRALEARQQQAEQKQLEGLALRAREYGVPDEVVYGHVSNRDFGGLAQSIGQARRDSTGRGSSTTKSPELDALKDNFDLLSKERGDYIKDGAEVPADIEKEYQETKKLLVGARKSLYMKPEANAPAAPEPVAKAAPASISPEVQAVQNVDLSKIPYAQQEQYVKDLEAKAGEEAAVNKAWNDAQLGLQSKLEKAIGTGNVGNTNYSKLRGFAQAVVNNELAPFTPEGAGPEFETAVPVGHLILDQLGISPSAVALAEPGNRRTGTQQVTYDDLLKTWAKNYLGVAPVTAAPQVPAIPAKKASVLDSLLDSSMKPTQ